MKKAFYLAIAVSLGIVTFDTFHTSSWAASPEHETNTEQDHHEHQNDPPLIVHEWGTFTSFSGSDGIRLGFRPLVHNDLPRFVKETFPSGTRQAFKRSVRAIQRMETPVTYFYTPVERDVEVRVEFPEGLLTEYFPPVRGHSPALDARELKNVGQGQQPNLKNGMLDWGTIHLIPPESLRAHVADDELARRIGREAEKVMVEPATEVHYSAARLTDSAIVQVREKLANTFIDYFEKFLFYRGIGNFELPVAVTDQQNGTFQLENSGSDEIRSLFLVTVKGEQVWFRKFDSAAPDSVLTLQQSADESDIGKLTNAMVQSLIDEGLYPKEASAMVRCWRSSWFAEEGTRLLYLVPTKITNSLLPLHVSPAPDEVVRVLVGRMELLSESEENRLLDLVRKSALRRQENPNASAENRSPSINELLAMGRLAEPALIRIQNISNDERLRSEAKTLVDELRKIEN